MAKVFDFLVSDPGQYPHLTDAIEALGGSWVSAKDVHLQSSVTHTLIRPGGVIYNQAKVFESLAGGRVLVMHDYVMDSKRKGYWLDVQEYLHPFGKTNYNYLKDKGINKIFQDESFIVVLSQAETSKFSQVCKVLKAGGANIVKQLTPTQLRNRSPSELQKHQAIIIDQQLEQDPNYKAFKLDNERRFQIPVIYYIVMFKKINKLPHCTNKELANMTRKSFRLPVPMTSREQREMKRRLLAAKYNTNDRKRGPVVVDLVTDEVSTKRRKRGNGNGNTDVITISDDETDDVKNVSHEVHVLKIERKVILRRPKTEIKPEIITLERKPFVAKANIEAPKAATSTDWKPITVKREANTPADRKPFKSETPTRDRKARPLKSESGTSTGFSPPTDRKPRELKTDSKEGIRIPPAPKWNHEDVQCITLSSSDDDDDEITVLSSSPPVKVKTPPVLELSPPVKVISAPTVRVLSPSVKVPPPPPTVLELSPPVLEEMELVPPPVKIQKEFNAVAQHQYVTLVTSEEDEFEDEGRDVDDHWGEVRIKNERDEERKREERRKEIAPGAVNMRTDDATMPVDAETDQESVAQAPVVNELTEMEVEEALEIQATLDMHNAAQIPTVLEEMPVETEPVPGTEPVPELEPEKAKKPEEIPEEPEPVPEKEKESEASPKIIVRTVVSSDLKLLRTVLSALKSRQKLSNECIDIENVKQGSLSFDKRREDQYLVKLNKKLTEYQVSIPGQITRSDDRMIVSLEDGCMDFYQVAVITLENLAGLTDTFKSPTNERFHDLWEKFLLQKKHKLQPEQRVYLAHSTVRLFMRMWWLTGVTFERRMFALEYFREEFLPIDNYFEGDDEFFKRCTKQFNAALRDEGETKPAILGLYVMVKTLQRDLEFWLKHSKKETEQPLINFLFTGKDRFEDQLKQFLTDFGERCLLPGRAPTEVKTAFFKLLACTALWLSYCDYKKEQTAFNAHECYKVNLGRLVINLFVHLEDKMSTNALYSNLCMLRPSWLRVAVVKGLLKKQEGCPMICETDVDSMLSEEFQGLSLECDKEQRRKIFLLQSLFVENSLDSFKFHAVHRSLWRAQNEAAEKFTPFKRLTTLKKKDEKTPEEIIVMDNRLSVDKKAMLAAMEKINLVGEEQEEKKAPLFKWWFVQS